MEWEILPRWQIMSVAVVGGLYGFGRSEGGHFRYIEASIAVPRSGGRSGQATESWVRGVEVGTGQAGVMVRPGDQRRGCGRRSCSASARFAVVLRQSVIRDAAARETGEPMEQSIVPDRGKRTCWPVTPWGKTMNGFQAKTREIRHGSAKDQARLLATLLALGGD